MRGHSLLLAAVLLAACYAPSIAPGLTCDEDGRCPDGQFCNAENVCGEEQSVSRFDGGLKSVSCDEPLPCPAGSNGLLNLCGRIIDLERGTLIGDSGGTGRKCDGEAPTEEGPCALALTFIDAFQQTPLSVENFSVDDCGRYVASGIERPPFGFVAVQTADAFGLDDRRVKTSLVFESAGIDTQTDVDVFVVERALDQQWTSSAGMPFGPTDTFASVGSTLVLYRYKGEPKEGVSVSRGGESIPEDDFYFTNLAENTHIEIDSVLAQTSSNGAALVVDVGVGTSLTGQGAEEPGCEWASVIAGSVAGQFTVFFIEEVSVGTSDACQ